MRIVLGISALTAATLLLWAGFAGIQLPYSLINSKIGAFPPLPYSIPSGTLHVDDLHLSSAEDPAGNLLTLSWKASVLPAVVEGTAGVTATLRFDQKTRFLHVDGPRLNQISPEKAFSIANSLFDEFIGPSLEALQVDLSRFWWIHLLRDIQVIKGNIMLFPSYAAVLFGELLIAALLLAILGKKRKSLRSATVIA